MRNRNLKLSLRHIAAILACSILFVPSASHAKAAKPTDPPHYQPKPTWHQTMLASREALSDSAKLYFASPVIRAGEAARPIDVNISGCKELFLFVIGAPDVVRGLGDWADARLIDKAGKTTRLCELKSLRVWDGQHSTDSTLESGVSGPLRIAGQQFEHGIEVYASSKIQFTLDGKYERLQASIGIADWAGQPAALRFIVTDAAGAARCDLWDLCSRDFTENTPRREMKWEREDRILDEDWQTGDYSALALRYAQACRVPKLAQAARQLASRAKDPAGLRAVRGLYLGSRMLDDSLARAKSLNFEALRLAITDLQQSFPKQYPNGARYLDRLSKLQASLADALSHFTQPDGEDFQAVASLVLEFDQLRQEALLANPLLDFDRLALIDRQPDGDPRLPIGTGFGVGEYIGLPRQTSKHTPGIDRPFAWDNRIAVLSPVRPDGNLTTLYQPDRRRLLNDMKLHWDADRLLFAMPGSHDKWQVFELGADGTNLRQVTPGDQPDVHNYDPCYLPNGKIAFLSTACLQGVPCNAGVIVGMMYTMNADGSGIRQICFEQDHDYCPTVLNDGRIMYMRWDYTDTPHVWNRMLFTCNPDGTGQMEYYGANSYWPNAIFYARAIPNHPTQVVGIVTGHHVGRVGELVLFDPSKGRFEANGVVQRIPGRGQKVQPLIQDKLTEHSWPKFLHPYPLSDKYFIVSAKPTSDSLWGIYLVDTFDNMVLLKELEGRALLEPIPLRKTVTPPVIPDKVKLDEKDAIVYLENVYQGVSMRDVPAGTIKKLRVFTYHFAYQQLAGIDHRIGANGPWEAKRVLGTIDVDKDGSALFRIPAKTPISVQPLDADGKAVQLMRSWMTAQPGEMLSCVGCHDNRGASPPVSKTLALSRPPQAIQPWLGPTRGFAFSREVQPVLDKYCVACHDGKPRPDGTTLVNLRGDQNAWVCYRGGDPVGTIVRDTPRQQLIGKYGGIFEPAYIALRRHVRVPGFESDLHLLEPMEFHADTTELMQLLRKGHHNVQLDAEAWDRLTTWIDLNAPCHGAWGEFARINGKQTDRRRELQRLYGGIDQDAEEPPPVASAPITPIMPPALKAPPQRVQCDGWPFDAAEARRRQTALGETTRTIDLGNGITLRLVKIPAGRFVMGDTDGADDETPQAAINIDRPFWIGQLEVTNEQFALFDSTHDSRYEHRSSWIFSEQYLGWPMNRPKQPAVRVSWQDATRFCRWLSEKSGQTITLPTEAQWEYACRAGSETPLSFGDTAADFSPFANLADYTIRNLAYEGWRPRSPDLVPRESKFNDHALVTADAGNYRPNAWGLHDMHGNAAEWVRSVYKPYPYRDDDGRNDPTAQGQRVVRGGSWYDRPARCRSSFRLAYQPWQRIFNVGFRIVCEDAPPRAASAQ